MSKARWLLVPLFAVAVVAFAATASTAAASASTPRPAQLTATPLGTPPPPPLDPGGLVAGDPDDLIEGNRLTADSGCGVVTVGDNVVTVPGLDSLWLRVAAALVALQAALP
jgi:hypothetical protein